MRTAILICVTSLFVFTSFDSRKKSKLKLPEEFVKIPSGMFSFKNVNAADSTERMAISEFYMSKFEVSNSQYRQFYSEVSSGLSEQERQNIMCDTLGWATASTYGEPLKKYYYSHPAYNNFPVVNISYEGAIKYCEWLQQKLQKENGDYTIEVKLPTKEQWIWAAMAGRKQAMFPWGNYFLRNKKGEYLCNFRRVGDQAIVRNRKTGKPEVVEGMTDRSLHVFTTAVKSFYPSDWGLYNMCGNAAEMILEKGICMGGSWNDYGGDIHIRSEASYEKSSATVGFRPIIIVKEKSKQ